MGDKRRKENHHGVRKRIDHILISKIDDGNITLKINIRNVCPFSCNDGEISNQDHGIVKVYRKGISLKRYRKDIIFTFLSLLPLFSL